MTYDDLVYQASPMMVGWQYPMAIMFLTMAIWVSQGNAGGGRFGVSDGRPLRVLAGPSTAWDFRWFQSPVHPIPQRLSSLVWATNITDCFWAGTARMQCCARCVVSRVETFAACLTFEDCRSMVPKVGRWKSEGACNWKLSVPSTWNECSRAWVQPVIVATSHHFFEWEVSTVVDVQYACVCVFAYGG